MEPVSRLYERYEDAAAAVEALAGAGFDRASIGLIGPYNNQSVDPAWVDENEPRDNPERMALGAAAGATLVGGGGVVAGFVLGLGLVPLPMIGPAMAVGPLAAAVIGGIFGGLVGTALGALVTTDPPSLSVNEYSRAQRPAAAMVLVSAPEGRVEAAREVMDGFGPIPGRGPRLRPRLAGGLRR